MWSFQGQRPASMPGRPRDSFAEALAELDDIPATYHETSRGTRLSTALSTAPTECTTPNDDARSIASVHFPSHPAVGWSGASGSTLKAFDDGELTPIKLEAEEEQRPPPPQLPRTVGFWNTSLRGTRRRVFLKYSQTCESQ